MINHITAKFVQTALFGIIGVTAACGAVGSAHLLAVAGGSLMCAAGAAIDED